MKKNLLISAFLCSTFILASCDSTDKQAAAKLSEAQAAYESGHYEDAKSLIDSIKVLYPKAYDVRHQGNRLMQDIELAVEHRNVAYLDSIVADRQSKLESMKAAYAFEKDAEYQQTGNYLAPSQVIEKNLHRSYLRFQTDESGQMSMTSIYCGSSNINHTSVRVTAPDGSFAETPASKDSYETTDMSEKIEKADYKYGEDGGVADFVADNKDKNLRLTFNGDRSYSTTMTAADKNASASIRELSEVLRAITEANKQIEDAKLKIRFIEKKISEREDSGEQ